MPKALSRERWRALSPELDHALDLPASQRAAWLSELRARHPSHADDLEAMLAAHDELVGEGFLDGVLGQPKGYSLAGQSVGAYTLREPLGQGGMGSVWLAERSDGRFEGQVAVKLLNAALWGRAGEARFRQEGRILARLRHPNIALLLDAGHSAHGQPYIVLEHIAGEPVDAYCDARRLDIGARIRLFADVLGAVAHAHASLIVHRDLKPSNVMVSVEGRVKLLDFGIAKLLEGDEGVGETTREGGAVCTPYYAAPEQISGGAVTTATDVYALGVLLYLLLTGLHPLGPPPASAAELSRQVLEGEPPRPSAAVVAPRAEAESSPAGRAAARSTTPERLARALRGDLDTIVAKALKKDPSERYASVTEFAEDLRRHLAHEPIGARPDAFFYRAGRFVRRNRVAAGLTALLALALAGGVVSTAREARSTAREAREAARQRDLALAQADRAENVNDFNGFLLGDAPAGAPVSLPEILKRAEVLGEKSARRDPALTVDVLVNVGEIYAAREELDGAQRTLARAYALSKTVTDPAPRAKAACAWGRMIGFGAGDQAEALRLIDEGLAFTTDEASFDGVVATCLLGRGTIGIYRNSATIALESAERALARLDRRPGAFPGLRASALETLASGLTLAGRRSEAERMYARAFEQFRLVGREDSVNATTLLSNWATITAMTNTVAALEQNRRAVAPGADGSLDHAPVPRLLNYALQLTRLARAGEARAVLERTIELAQRGGNKAAAGVARVRLAQACVALADLACARDTLRVAAEDVPPAYPSGHRVRGELARTQALLAEAEGRDADAYRLMGEAQAIHGASKEAASPTQVETLLELSRLELRRGSASAAEQHARAALTLAEGLRGDAAHSAWTGRSQLALGRAREALGDTAEARKLFGEAVRHLTPTLGEGHPVLNEARQRAAGAP